MKKISLLLLVISILALSWAQGTKRVILWKSTQQGDPEFATRAQRELMNKFNQIGAYEFIGQDTIKQFSEKNLFPWPINNNIIKDSIAQGLNVKYQMNFFTSNYNSRLERSFLYLFGEELVSYQLDLIVREADTTFYQARIEVDTLIEHGWCGLKDCKVNKRSSQDELKLKTYLLNKGIELILIDAQPFFKEE